MWLCIGGIAVLFAGMMLWAAVASRSVKVGVAYSVFNNRVTAETEMLTAVRAYVRRHNSRGARPMLRMVPAFYRRTPREAIHRLAEEGVAAVIAGTTSHAAEDLARLAARERIPLIAVSATTAGLTGRDDWVFRVRNDLAQDAVLYRRLCALKGIDRFLAVMPATNIVYSAQLAREIADGGPELSGLVVAQDGRLESHTDRYDPEAVLVTGPASFSGMMLQRVRRRWPESLLLCAPWGMFGLPGTHTPLFCGSYYYVEQFSPFHLDEAHPFLQYWNRHYALSYDGTVHYTFLAMELLVKALRNNPAARGEELRSLLAKVRSVDGPAGRVSIDRFGDARGRGAVFFRGPHGWNEVFLQ